MLGTHVRMHRQKFVGTVVMIGKES